MAIDPPYRLDPFQNIINVKWDTEAWIAQVFVWLRWDTDDGGLINRESGYFFPVSDEFWAAAVAADKAEHPKLDLDVAAIRDNLSDLIEAGLTNSQLFRPGLLPPAYAYHFFSAWESFNQATGSWPAVQPTLNSGGTTFHVYHAVLGYYRDDDMGTASGHFPPTYPPFMPPMP